MADFQTAFAKALSAMANSGGGHIIFGQEDDGTLTGVDAMVKRTALREWLEQKLPTLLAYPLEAFRVHQVVKDCSSSAIAAGKAVIVIDVGDSRLAPHQAYFPPDKPQYYYRQGGKSIAAPHHYLEALRNRLAYAVLEAELATWQTGGCIVDGEGYAVVEICLRFSLTNVSRVACYKWDLDCRITGEGIDEFIRTQAQVNGLRCNQGIRVDTTILPTRRAEHVIPLGFRVNLKESLALQVRENWPKIMLAYYPISENHIAAERVTQLSGVASASSVLEQMRRCLENVPGGFTP
jgi:hypothetical protein